jgi:hypothetical protein
MRIIGAIQAFNEERRIGAAVRSLFEVGCDKVFVLDGAWLLPDGSPFGGGDERSDDYTIGEAKEAGAHARFTGVPYANDAAKQTALIHQCGAQTGDYVLKIDADERIQGKVYTTGSHALVMLRNHGENDLPGFRGTWPRGDDAETAIPLLRMFKYRSDLFCARPGRWRSDEGWLEPYLVGALKQQLEQRPNLTIDRALAAIREHEAVIDPRALTAFPILDEVWIDHYRDGARVEAKRAYYEAMAV